MQDTHTLLTSGSMKHSRQPRDLHFLANPLGSAEGHHAGGEGHGHVVCRPPAPSSPPVALLQA